MIGGDADGRESDRVKRLRPSDILYFAVLVGVGTLSVALPEDRALVQGIAIGATAALLLLGLLEQRARRRRGRPTADDETGRIAP